MPSPLSLLLLQCRIRINPDFVQEVRDGLSLGMNGAGKFNSNIPFSPFGKATSLYQSHLPRCPCHTRPTCHPAGARMRTILWYCHLGVGLLDHPDAKSSLRCIHWLTMILIGTRFCNLHRDATWLHLRQTSNWLNSN